ncbi:RNA polymerase sigma factor [Geomonas limicola]|uniref:RNA polymerase sigma factor n=1 Tax=Geomonas limicola TaxID=2740186 RepID=A0A6V8NDW3_9BACT|nr:RNA polymerase sigma factor [Geomonas limicola]
MNDFLAGVERKAFRMAALGTGNEDDALDIIQDAMLAFVRKYAEHPEPEWAPLFYRVLQSRITDYHRRSQVRNRLRSFFGLGDEPDREDPLEQMPDLQAVPADHRIAGEQLAASLEQALRRLPLRQQQAFLMRAWEGLDTRQTATAMGCSEGSVKTHYFRALQALRQLLEEFRP